MINSLKVNDIEVKINHKIENLDQPIKDTISELIQKWFENKLDTYLKKYVDENNPEVHLNLVIEKTTKWTYNGNFNLKVGNENIIYKREWFENVLDLVNHFFTHCKEEFSKK